MKILARMIPVIVCIGILVACGKAQPPGKQPEPGLPEINVPRTGQEYPAGVTITATGTVPDGAAAMVSVNGAAPITAVMADTPHEGQRQWTAELSDLAAGAHTITVTAEVAGEVLQSEPVPFRVVAVAAGLWDGAFVLYDRNGEVSVEGTMQVIYSQNWFRMRFDVNQITGTTDGWEDRKSVV